MDSKTFVEIFSMARHDFLNHLQVISGLVQLNKADRVRDYINQVSSDMAVMSKASHIENPEISEFLLVLYYLGEKNQIRVVYNIDENVGKSTVPGDLLSNILRETVALSMNYLVSDDNYSKELFVAVERSKNCCYIKITSGKIDTAKAEDAREKAAGLNNELEPYGGCVDISLTEGKGQLKVKLPVEKP